MKTTSAFRMLATPLVLILILISSQVFITGCEGPEGPQGPQGPQGAQGIQGEAGTSCSVVDNGDGTFTLTCDGSSVTFGETDEPDAYTNADLVRGGQLYDKYWDVTGGDAPTTDHSLYPDLGSQSGESTWRCKECHGWDYMGKDGRYGSGSHYTGIRGLYPATVSLWRAYITIREDHGYSTSELSDSDVWDLVKFYKEGVIDVSMILDGNGDFWGDIKTGNILFNSGIPGFQSGSATSNMACATCHGADGTVAIEPDTEFPGFLSNENPPEFLHKVRFGHPSTLMPAAESINASLLDVADLSAYAQTLSPVPWNSTSVSRGAQLYDEYWAVSGGSEPVGEHPLYPVNGSQSGSGTWRCKECHGWDYTGNEGGYSSGSHYTGIGGIYPPERTKWQAFEAIKTTHGYDSGELSDTDIWDLVAFYDAGTYDVNFIINPDGTFKGDTAAGHILYDNGIGGGMACATCHGADGTVEVEPGHTEFPGFLSNENPQEFAHKVFFGNPGTAMVITYDFGATLQNVADLAAYCQTLPQN